MPKKSHGSHAALCVQCGLKLGENTPNCTQRSHSSGVGQRKGTWWKPPRSCVQGVSTLAAVRVE